MAAYAFTLVLDNLCRNSCIRSPLFHLPQSSLQILFCALQFLTVKYFGMSLGPVLHESLDVREIPGQQARQLTVILSGKMLKITQANSFFPSSILAQLRFVKRQWRLILGVKTCHLHE